MSSIDFSVVTVTFNSGDTLLDCIKSVHSQKDVLVQHVIKDNLSKDNTKSVAVNEKRPHDLFVEHADDGVYDAMNQAISHCKGRYIAILNSDDYFYSDDILSKVSSTFEKHNADIVYTNINYVSDAGDYIRAWKPPLFRKGDFKYGFHPPHPGVFVSRSIYDVTKFDTRYRIAGDFELLLRLFENAELRICYLDITSVNMRMGGLSNTFKGRLKGMFELFSILRKHYRMRSAIALLVRRYISKLSRLL